MLACFTTMMMYVEVDEDLNHKKGKGDEKKKGKPNERRTTIGVVGMCFYNSPGREREREEKTS